jgi:hypothetical protein
MADEVDPQAAPDAAAPVEQPIAEGSAPEAAAPEQSMLDAIGAALKDDEPSAPAEPTDDRPRGPDGRFLPKDGAQPDPTKPADPAKPAETKPADLAKPTEDAFKEPEGLSEGAQERFRSLVGMVRERDTRIEQAEAQVGEMRQAVEGFQRMIVDSGANDQELVALFDFARAIKSGNWAAAEPMLAHLTQQYRVAMGRDPNGADPFSAHPDLAQAVQEGKITAEAAREVLRARQVLADEQRRTQAVQAEQQTQQQYVASVQRATAEVGQMVRQWSATDLDWPRKQAMLQTQAVEIAKALPPEQWGFALQSAYKLIGETLKASAPARVTPTAGAQPLRPSAASVGRREPSNMAEAISAALGAAG